MLVLNSHRTPTLHYVAPVESQDAAALLVGDGGQSSRADDEQEEADRVRDEMGEDSEGNEGRLDEHADEEEEAEERFPDGSDEEESDPVADRGARVARVVVVRDERGGNCKRDDARQADQREERRMNLLDRRRGNLPASQQSAPFTFLLGTRQAHCTAFTRQLVALQRLRLGILKS